MSQVAGSRTPDPEYRSLYRLVGVAAWIVAFLTVVEIFAFILFPPPSTVSDWFVLVGIRLWQLGHLGDYKNHEEISNHSR